MRVTVLGCGGSGGVPMIGGADGAGEWGDCDPHNPRNRRTRSSVLVQDSGETILIDTSPDLRAQLLAARTPHISAVLFTHAHADHVHGIDDLRAVKYFLHEKIPIYGTATTLADLRARFPYVFQGSGIYEPTLVANAIDGPFAVGGVSIRPFDQVHGDDKTVGYRIGGMAYSTDVVDLEEDAFSTLAGVDLWIVDCLRMNPHPTHAHFARTMEWIDRIRPRHALLTHLSIAMDYDSVLALCPPGVEPAYDGMTVEIP